MKFFFLSVTVNLYTQTGNGQTCNESSPGGIENQNLLLLNMIGLGNSPNKLKLFANIPQRSGGGGPLVLGKKLGGGGATCFF